MAYCAHASYGLPFSSAGPWHLDSSRLAGGAHSYVSVHHFLLEKQLSELACGTHLIVI